MHCGAVLKTACENYSTTCTTVDTHAYSSLWMVQWNLSNADTIGTKDFVLYREVSLTQG